LPYLEAIPKHELFVLREHSKFDLRFTSYLTSPKHFAITLVVLWSLDGGGSGTDLFLGTKRCPLSTQKQPPPLVFTASPII